MNQIIVMFVVLTLSLIQGSLALAAPQKIQIAEFSVTGAENASELKAVLKNLLSTRIATDGVVVTDDGNGIIARISGSYTAIGKAFSIDASVKNAAGETLGQRYVQGESQNDLIAAIGKLADQLRPLLTVTPVPAIAKPAEDIVRSAPASQPLAQQTRIEGALLGIAPGRKLSGNEREFVTADEKAVYLYRQTETLKKVAEYPLKSPGKILSIDTGDVDADGYLEVYVTVMDRDQLVSVALSVTDQGFAPIANNLPYFFRAVELNGQSRKLVAQFAGRGADDFYGDVCFLVKKGNTFSLGTPVKLPKHGQVFSFNSFTAAEGKQYAVYIDTDGQLRVADGAGKELWKGNDRFGGSEVYYLRDEQQMQNVAMDRYRWRFLEQRVTVTNAGEIIIPKNSGLLAIGNNRSYSKSILTAYVWNGANLEERWHTKESPSYLADYYYDADHKELVLLEHAQKEGVFSKGASVIIIRKVD